MVLRQLERLSIPLVKRKNILDASHIYTALLLGYVASQRKNPAHISFIVSWKFDSSMLAQQNQSTHRRHPIPNPKTGSQPTSSSLVEKRSGQPNRMAVLMPASHLQGGFLVAC